jgi:hypothetical protein
MVRITITLSVGFLVALLTGCNGKDGDVSSVSPCDVLSAHDHTVQSLMGSLNRDVNRARAALLALDEVEAQEDPDSGQAHRLRLDFGEAKSRADATCEAIWHTRNVPSHVASVLRTNNPDLPAAISAPLEATPPEGTCTLEYEESAFEVSAGEVATWTDDYGEWLAGIRRACVEVAR